MGDKSNPFNDEAWERPYIEEGNLDEFLPVPSASAVSSKNKGHNTDPNKWCPVCHKKPCIRASTVSSEKIKEHSTDPNKRCPRCHTTPCGRSSRRTHDDTGRRSMPIRWLPPRDSDGAVVVNRHPSAPTVAQTYHPKLTMESVGLFDDEMFQQSGNVFGTSSPLVPTLPGEDFRGLLHKPWPEQDTLGQEFPGGVLNPDRDPNDPFGMGGSNKSSKKAYNNLKKSSRKSSKKSKKKSSRKARKASRKARKSARK